MNIRKIYKTYHFGCSFDRQTLQDRIDKLCSKPDYSKPNTNKHGYVPPDPEEIREGYALVSDDGLVFHLHEQVTRIY